MRTTVIALTGTALVVAALGCGPAAGGAPAPSVLPPTAPVATAVPPPTAAPPEPTAAPIPAVARGLVWKDRCLLTGGQAGEPLVLGQGCVSTGPNPWDWGANQIFEPGFEPGIGGVTIHLGAGACPSIGVASVLTLGDGTYAFEGLPPGMYCISFNPLGDGNDSQLIPGGLSFPTRGGEAQTTVTLDSGETETVNYGWTFQFGD